MFEGRVVAIYVASAAGAPMEPRDEVEAVAGLGLAGDRYAKRAVTLIEREAIDTARAEAGIPLDERETRRNVVTVGVPLNHLVDRVFTVGPVRLRGVNLSEPC